MFSWAFPGKKRSLKEFTVISKLLNVSEEFEVSSGILWAWINLLGHGLPFLLQNPMSHCQSRLCSQLSAFGAHGRLCLFPFVSLLAVRDFC